MDLACYLQSNNNQENTLRAYKLPVVSRSRSGSAFASTSLTKPGLGSGHSSRPFIQSIVSLMCSVIQYQLPVSKDRFSFCIQTSTLNQALIFSLDKLSTLLHLVRCQLFFKQA